MEAFPASFFSAFFLAGAFFVLAGAFFADDELDFALPGFFLEAVFFLPAGFTDFPDFEDFLGADFPETDFHLTTCALFL